MTDKAAQRKAIEEQLAKYFAQGGSIKQFAYKDKAKEKAAQRKVTA